MEREKSPRQARRRNEEYEIVRQSSHLVYERRRGKDVGGISSLSRPNFQL